MAIGDLGIRLRAETATFESDMGRAAHVAQREMERMLVRAEATGKMIGDAISKIAGKFGQLIGDTLKAGDELSKLSQKSGIAVERLSELQFAAQLGDVGFGQLTTGIGFFNKALAEAQKEGTKSGQLFRALGVDINAGPQKALEQFAAAINKLPDGETKVAAMRIAFGRAGDAMIPMIAQLDEATERARKLGLVMGEQLARDSERFNDAITALRASGSALAIQVLNPAASALATIAENLVKAREGGTMLRDTVIELAKVFVAAHGEILSYVPFWGKTLEEQAQRAFNALERLRQGTATGVIRRPPGEMGPPAPSDLQARTSCAVSGGRWENGACVYSRPRAAAGGGGSRRDEAAAAAERDRLAQISQARRIQEADLRAFQDTARQVASMTSEAQEWERLRNAWGEDAFLGMSLEDARTWVASTLSGIDALRGLEEQAMRVAAGFTEEGRAIADATRKTDDFAKSLGLTFSSAFENAIVKGMKLRDVLQGIAQDIARMLVRKTITEPLANTVGGWLSNGLGSLFGGSGAAPIDTWVGGRRGAGQPLLVGEQGPEVWVPDTAGTMIPNSKLGGGGPTVYIDARGADREGLARVERTVRELHGSIEQRSVAAVGRAMSQGKL